MHTKVCDKIKYFLGMITKKNLRETLRNLGFTAGHSSFNLHNILSKSFPECGVKISVDFDNEKIHYPQGIHADRDTAINFSKKENFVVLECVANLLQHGYKPEHIVLEPSTPGGWELLR